MLPVCCNSTMKISSILNSNEIVLDNLCLLKRYMEMKCSKCKDVVYVKV
ncbi:MAG: hypothetical protein HYT72_03835 [Candidatus Aenigmarchaeota archaeon]|nr:hypothetical protein [Candidatus Aenigmarchaeota archaeon]